MSSEKKKKGGQQLPSISDEEWDFTGLSDGADLQTVIEYEYLRSSQLREKIIEWQSQSCADTEFARPPFFKIGLIRAAGLISISDQSPLGRLQIEYENIARASASVAPGMRARHVSDVPLSLLAEATEQMKSVQWSGTIGQAIQKLFKVRTAKQPALGRISEADVYNTLSLLERNLPAELKTAHAEKVALRFDRFPDAWIQMQRDEAQSKLSRRSAPGLPQAEPLWELPREHAHMWFEPSRRCAPLGVRLHAFLINWREDRGQIIASFDRWVKKYHVQSRPGAPGEESWLKRLSAYRISTIGKGTYAETYQLISNRVNTIPSEAAQQARKVLPIFDDESSWHRAVSRVRKDIKGDFIAKIRKDFRCFAEPNRRPVGDGLFEY